jgi:hypothetical protein
MGEDDLQHRCLPLKVGASVTKAAVTSRPMAYTMGHTSTKPRGKLPVPGLYSEEDCLTSGGLAETKS